MFATLLPDSIQKIHNLVGSGTLRRHVKSVIYLVDRLVAEEKLDRDYWWR